MKNTFGGYSNKATIAQQRTMFAKETQSRLESILQTTKSPLKVWDELEPKLLLPEQPVHLEPHWRPKPVRQKKEYKSEKYSIVKPNEKEFFNQSRQDQIFFNIVKMIGVVILITVALIIGFYS